MSAVSTINKGRISSVNEGKKTAVVIPQEATANVTHELVVPFFLWECLKVNMEVVYVTFSDTTGIIIARLDGEWNHKIWQTVDVFGTAHVTDGVSADSTMRVTGSVEIQSTLQVEGSVNTGSSITAGGGVTAPAVTGGGISLAGHTHTGVNGETSGPH